MSLKDSEMSKVNLYRSTTKTPAYVTNPNSPNQENAIKWATGSKFTSRDTKDKAKEGVHYRLDTVDNIFINPKFVRLSIRGNGGRAYVVTIESNGQKFDVDMREDAIVEAMSHGKIENGIIYGTYAFLPYSNIPLVSVNSPDYKDWRKNIEKKEINVVRQHVTDTKLEVGKTYEDKSRSLYIYMGNVFVYNAKSEKTSKRPLMLNINVRDLANIGNNVSAKEVKNLHPILTDKIKELSDLLGDKQSVLDRKHFMQSYNIDKTYISVMLDIKPNSLKLYEVDADFSNCIENIDLSNVIEVNNILNTNRAKQHLIHYINYQTANDIKLFSATKVFPEDVMKNFPKGRLNF